MPCYYNIECVVAKVLMAYFFIDTDIKHTFSIVSGILIFIVTYDALSNFNCSFIEVFLLLLLFFTIKNVCLIIRHTFVTEFFLLRKIIVKYYPFPLVFFFFNQTDSLRYDSYEHWSWESISYFIYLIWKWCTFHRIVENSHPIECVKVSS